MRIADDPESNAEHEFLAQGEIADGDSRGSSIEIANEILGELTSDKSIAQRLLLLDQPEIVSALEESLGVDSALDNEFNILAFEVHSEIPLISLAVLRSSRTMVLATIHTLEGVLAVAVSDVSDLMDRHPRSPNP